MSPKEGNYIPVSDQDRSVKFTREYKIKILKMGANCRNLTELKALLKQERLHSAQLSKWRREFSNYLSYEHAKQNPGFESQPLALAPATSQAVINNGGSGSHETTIDPREIIAKIWRRKWLMLSSMLVTMVLALFLLNSLTPSYTSKALIMLGNQNSNLTIANTATSSQVDIGTKQNELEILRSYSIAERVIKKLKLDQYAEFNPTQKSEGALSKLFGIFGSNQKPSDPGLLDPESSGSSISLQTIPVIEKFLKKQKLALLGESSVIEVKFTSENPVLAAKITNTLLETYLDDQIKSKFSATSKTNDWLNNRVKDLSQKVKSAERAVEEYRKSSGLLQSANGNALYNQQISELNTQLILSGNELAEKEARLQHFKRSSGSTESDQIRRLREQKTTLEATLAELSTSYGQKHPKVIKVLAEKNEIQIKIALEIKNITSGLRNEVNIAHIKENKLKSRLADLENKLSGSGEHEVQLRSLEREAEANRKLLTTFLSRFKETSGQTNLEAQQADAKIISSATPAREPSFPKKGPILALALFGSLLIGLISVFIRELFDNGFRSGVQIETETGFPSWGLIPNLGKIQMRLNKPENYVNKFPASPLSEAIRSAYTSMIFGKNSFGSAKVIQFTSAYPDEGKSTAARCMAIIKAQSGMKSLVIDADLRSPSVHSTLKIRPQPGLAEYLSGNADLSEIVTHHKKTGIYVITAGHATKSPTDLLPDQKMDELLTDLSEVFDLIIFDSPPVLAVPDARILASKVDLTVFAVKWADTRKEVVRFGLKQLVDSGASRIGTILTMVDIKKHSQYSFADSGAYVGNFKKYYDGGKSNLSLLSNKLPNLGFNKS